jgi:hypothetical protein
MVSDTVGKVSEVAVCPYRSATSLSRAEMSSVFPALSSPAMTIFAERDGGSDGLSKPGWLDVQTWRREDYKSESHLPSSCVERLRVVTCFVYHHQTNAHDEMCLAETAVPRTLVGQLSRDQKADNSCSLGWFLFSLFFLDLERHRD